MLKQMRKSNACEYTLIFYYYIIDYFSNMLVISFYICASGCAGVYNAFKGDKGERAIVGGEYPKRIIPITTFSKEEAKAIMDRTAP